MYSIILLQELDIASTTLFGFKFFPNFGIFFLQLGSRNAVAVFLNDIGKSILGGCVLSPLLAFAVGYCQFGVQIGRASCRERV